MTVKKFLKFNFSGYWVRHHLKTTQLENYMIMVKEEGENYERNAD